MHKLRFIVVFPAIFVLFCIATTILSLIVILTFGRKQDFAVQYIAGLFGKAVLFVSSISMDIVYNTSKPLPPCVFTFNHSSTLDIFIILSLMLSKVRFIAKKELQYNPFFFIMGNISGQIFIDRKNSTKAIDQLKQAYTFIREKKFSIMVAPEATRSHKSKIGPFKRGAVHMALSLNYPIIPIYVDGADNLAKGSEWMSRPGKITVYINEPIDTTSWTDKDTSKHTQELRAKYLDWAGVKE